MPKLKDNPQIESSLIEAHRRLKMLMNELRDCGSADQIQAAGEMVDRTESLLRQIYGDAWVAMVEAGPKQ